LYLIALKGNANCLQFPWKAGKSPELCHLARTREKLNNKRVSWELFVYLTTCLVIIPCLRYTKRQLGSELRLLLLICVVRVVGIREKCRKNYEEIFNEKIFADFVNEQNEWKRRRDIQKVVFSVCFSGSLKFVILSLNSMEPCGVCHVVCVPFIFSTLLTSFQTSQGPILTLLFRRCHL